MSLERRTLRVEFSTETAFRSEYLSNISNGGVFIATSERLEVRDQVVVELELGWCGERVELEGEVVHRIGEEMAETGAVPGVAVQFDMPAKELRERFEGKLGAVESNERVNRSGRRAAPRTPARVQVRVQMIDGAEVECRSRDISTSGLLLSVEDWEPLPIGDEVGLVVAHPTSGEEMEVNGAVVRHLTTDAGEVAAIGVEFRTSAARRTEVANFVNEIRAAEHSRRLGGISGPVAELGIENLLQMFGASSPCGMLTVGRGVEEGVIVFEGGKLHSARLGRSTGAEALRTMLTWREGSFEFQAHLDDEDREGEGEGLSLSGAILDALCKIDEGARSVAAEATQPRKKPSSRPAPAVIDDAHASGAGGAGDDEAGLDLDLDIDLDLDDDALDAMAGDADGATPSVDTAPTARKPRTGGSRKLDPSLLPPRKKTSGVESATAARSRGGRDVSTAGSGASRGARAKPARVEAKNARSAGANPARTPKAKSKAKKARTSGVEGRKQGGASASGGAAGKAPAVSPGRIESGTRFEVDTARADAMRSELGKIEEAVLDLALVGMGVARMVEVIPEPELEVYRALDSLQERGILSHS